MRNTGAECILLTGGTGFLGSHLVEAFIEQGSKSIGLEPSDWIA